MWGSVAAVPIVAAYGWVKDHSKNRKIRRETGVGYGIKFADIFEYFCVVVGVFIYLYLIFLNFAVSGPKGILVNDFGSVAAHKNNKIDEHMLFLSRGHHNKIFLSLWFLINMFLMIRELSWHSGTSVFVNTLAYAFGEIWMRYLLLQLMGFGGAGYGLFGAFGGSADFHSLASSFNTMARLAFGMYDYDLYMSDGLGPKYDGIGLGEMAFFKYIMLWLTRFFKYSCIICLYRLSQRVMKIIKTISVFAQKMEKSFVQYNCSSFDIYFPVSDFLGVVKRLYRTAIGITNQAGKGVTFLHLQLTQKCCCITQFLFRLSTYLMRIELHHKKFFRGHFYA